MKIGKISCVVVAISLLTACATIKDSFYLGKKIKEIELGMSKDKVVSILGKNYSPLGAVDTPDGKFETIRYTHPISQTYSVYYVLNFRDSILAEWHQEE